MSPAIASLPLTVGGSLFLSVSTEIFLFSSNNCLASFSEEDNMEEDIELFISFDDELAIEGFNKLSGSSVDCSGRLRMTVLSWDR